MLEIPNDLAKPLPMFKQTSLFGVIRETPELIGASEKQTQEEFLTRSPS